MAFGHMCECFFQNHCLWLTSWWYSSPISQPLAALGQFRNQFKNQHQVPSETPPATSCWFVSTARTAVLRELLRHLWLQARVIDSCPLESQPIINVMWKNVSDPPKTHRRKVVYVVSLNGTLQFLCSFYTGCWSYVFGGLKANQSWIGALGDRVGIRLGSLGLPLGFIWVHLVTLVHPWFTVVSLSVHVGFALDSLGFTCPTWCHLVSLDFTWLRLVSLGFLGFIRFHLVSLLFTRFHLVSIGFTWSVISLGYIWFLAVTICFTWFHLFPLGLTWAYFTEMSKGKGKSCWSQKGRGQSSRDKREKGKASPTIWFKFHSTTRPRARTHEPKPKSIPRFGHYAPPPTSDNIILLYK